MANPNPVPRPENLKPIRPGEVRNPNGSSRKQRLTNALIKAIEEKGIADPFVQVGLREALKGDFRFWKEIFDRIDGKVPDKVEADLTTRDSPVKVVMPDNGRDPDAPAGPAVGVPGEPG